MPQVPVFLFDISIHPQKERKRKRMVQMFSGLQQQKEKREEPWLAVSLKPGNFVPGLIVGFLLGLFVDLSTVRRGSSRANNPSSFLRKGKGKQCVVSDNGGEELKMVLVVRQDLKMGAGKIASQCAHAATGIYAELMQSHRSLLRQWEQYGQAKIVLTCKNQQEMNKLKESADRIGLPTFIVSDAGRTQVLSGSRTVLAIGPGVSLSYLCQPVRFLSCTSSFFSLLLRISNGTDLPLEVAPLLNTRFTLTAHKD